MSKGHRSIGGYIGPSRTGLQGGIFSLKDQNLLLQQNQWTPGIVATGGNTVVDLGDYRYHTFTASGSFVVTSAPGNATIEYLVVAGGGAGGGGDVGGGGGAGGFRTNAVGFLSGRNSQAEAVKSISAGTYAITVGGGGDGVANPFARGGNGNPSTFDNITSLGGGGGAGYSIGSGANGGSGGGSTVQSTVAGLGTAGQGFDGGAGGDGGPNYPQTGGGGAGGNGLNPSSQSLAGAGGVGLPNPFGSAVLIGQLSGGVYYLAGGGGGGQESSGTPGSGGLGGGGAGGRQSPKLFATAGLQNTGGGGGGEDPEAGARGGSGLVILRYLK
jgi:hypothetical protein